MKYEMLTKVLDAIRDEAPEQFKRYHPNEENEEHINQARSLAYIHLLLKAKFNLVEFNERENYITDGSYDGGIDAYFIDDTNKVIYFIQSKFRTNAKNFENRFINLSEINSMDIERISEGNKYSENNIEYNGKIQGLIRKLSNIDQISRYNFKVIILANVDNDLENALERLITLPYEIYNYDKAYKELVFPVVRGTVHKATDISVNLNLGFKNNFTMDYQVVEGDYSTSVQLFFIPVYEIARLMSTHKNSILEYNPRSYLGAQDNIVNQSIKSSIIDREDNVFALYNNGITMLSDETTFTSRTGREGVGELSLVNPQIINGGQTAYTLSTILEDESIPNSKFDNKEVLVKVITFDQNMTEEENKLKFIQELSLTTNNQSEVTLADRNSNTDVQIEFQKYIFNKFGYFYNRKTGEYADGLKKGYILEKQLINRDTITRIVYSINGKVSAARRNSEDVLVKNQSYDDFFNTSIGEVGYDKIYYSYLCYKYLIEVEKTLRDRTDHGFGNALRYGKYAVVHVCSKFIDLEDHDYDESIIKNITDEILKQWVEFEATQSSKSSNDRYFYNDERLVPTVTESQSEELESIVVRVEDFDNYYKGSTIDEDLNSFDFQIQII